jgi:hypothetical protein
MKKYKKSNDKRLIQQCNPLKLKSNKSNPGYIKASKKK